MKDNYICLYCKGKKDYSEIVMRGLAVSFKDNNRIDCICDTCFANNNKENEK